LRNLPVFQSVRNQDFVKKLESFYISKKQKLVYSGHGEIPAGNCRKGIASPLRFEFGRLATKSGAVLQWRV